MNSQRSTRPARLAIPILSIFLCLCLCQGWTAEFAFDPIWNDLEAAQASASKGDYTEAGAILGRLRESVAACGRPRLINRWKSWVEQAEAMSTMTARLAGSRPTQERALLDRATLLTFTFGDPEAAQHLLAKQPECVESDASLPLTSLDTNRLTRLVRWYGSHRPGSIAGELNLRLSLHAALTELVDRASCGDALASGFEAKAQAIYKELATADFPPPLTGHPSVIDLVDGCPSNWDHTTDGLRNRGGQTLLAFPLCPNGSFELRLRLRIAPTATCRLDLPMPRNRRCSFVFAADSTTFETTGNAGAVAAQPVSGLSRNGDQVDVVIRAVKDPQCNRRSKIRPLNRAFLPVVAEQNQAT